MGVFRPRKSARKRPGLLQAAPRRPRRNHPSEHTEAPEAARVHEAEVPARSELHDRVGMLDDLSVRFTHQHATRHAKVDDPLGVGTLVGLSFSAFRGRRPRPAGSTRHPLQTLRSVRTQCACPCAALGRCGCVPKSWQSSAGGDFIICGFAPATPTQWHRRPRAGAIHARWFRLREARARRTVYSRWSCVVSFWPQKNLEVPVQTCGFVYNQPPTTHD